MNLQQLTRLRNDLLAARASIELAIIEVRLAAETLLATEAMRAPDAGLVVVKDDSDTDEGTAFPTERQWCDTTTGFVWFEVEPQPYDITTYPACDPSRLTIADGRGEGMATRDILGGMMISENVWAGPSGYATWAWWDSQLGDDFPWAYNHDHHASIVQRWHPDESTTLDCAAVPHATTWRPA